MKRKLLLFAAFFIAFPTFPGRTEGVRTVEALVIAGDSAAKERLSAGLTQVFAEARMKLSLSFAKDLCDGEYSALHRNRKEDVDFIVVSPCKGPAYGKKGEEPPEQVEAPVFLTSGDLPADVSADVVFRLDPSFGETLRGLAEKLAAAADDPVFVVANGEEAAFLKGLNVVSVPSENFNKNLAKALQRHKNKRKIHIVAARTPADAAKRFLLLREAGVEGDIFGLQPFETKEFSKAVGDKTDGARFYVPESPRFSLDAAPLMAELRCDGQNTEDETLYAYAAGQIYVKMMKKADAPSGGGTFKTALGVMRFRADGRRTDGGRGRFFVRRGEKIEILPQPFDK